MYTRVAEFQSTSKTNFNMLIYLAENSNAFNNLINKQLICLLKKISEYIDFVIFTLKKKIKLIVTKRNRKEIECVKANVKIYFLKVNKYLKKN